MKQEIRIEILGLGIILYSPENASHIKDGEDYFSRHFRDPDAVQKHIQKGDIVAFGTGSPGTFCLRFHEDYPDEKNVIASEMKLRLALRCLGGRVCFRDLYDLMSWSKSCPDEQVYSLPDGIYHITILSNTPPSGLLGDNQVIDIYFAKQSKYPDLAKEGIPSLV